jgi:hypothetical protein
MPSKVEARRVILDCFVALLLAMTTRPTSLRAQRSNPALGAQPVARERNIRPVPTRMSLHDADYKKRRSAERKLLFLKSKHLAPHPTLSP